MLYAQEQIGLQVICVDKGNEALKELIKSTSEFSNKQSLDQYLRDDCLSVLWSKGYLAASVDSLVQHEKKYIAYFFLGEQYAWGELKIGESERALLPLKWNLLLPSAGRMMKPTDFTDLAHQLLDQLEESGYPFASIQIDSSYWNNQQLHAVLKINAGPLYQIDSIRIDSKMHINPVFLSR